MCLYCRILGLYRPTVLVQLKIEIIMYREINQMVAVLYTVARPVDTEPIVLNVQAAVR